MINKNNDDDCNTATATATATANNSIQFWFINVPSQQPDGQLQKQHHTNNNGQ
jgi:hypothetical protein